MRYLKIILTIIAVLLAAEIAARMIPSAGAGGNQDVNIAAVGGKSLFLIGPSRDAIPVFVTNK